MPKPWVCGGPCTSGYFEATGDRGALDAAMQAHEKGFWLLNDYYNGITSRSCSTPAQPTRPDAKKP